MRERYSSGEARRSRDQAANVRGSLGLIGLLVGILAVASYPIVALEAGGAVIVVSLCLKLSRVVARADRGWSTVLSRPGPASVSNASDGDGEVVGRRR